MRNPTVQIKQAIKAKRYEFFAKITFADSTELVVDQKKIWQDGFVIDRAVSGQSAFEFGACVIGQFTLILNNAYGDFDGMSFDGAVVEPYVEFFGIPRWRIFGRWSMGEFTVDEVDTNDTFVKITCLDSMSLLDRPYSDVVMAYPASLYNIVNGIATVCGLTLRTAADWLPINDYTVAERPSEETLTCRDVLSYVCQATGNYAIINTDGELYIGHYDGAFLSELGDDYDDYTYHLFDIDKLYQFSRDNAQVMLTGVSIEVEQESYTAGTDEYMVHVKDNPMINAGAEQTFANALNTKINGWNFRPFDANHEISLLLEVGDNILLKDVTGKVYKSVVTRTEFSAGRHQTSECNAEPASLNASTRYSLAAKAAAQEVKVYDGTVNNYIDLVTKAYGMYRSAITDPDDASSKIYAFHNDESFLNSTFCMFENSNGIQVGRRDTASDPWVYTSADVEDAVVLAQTLVANTAIINALFSNDVTVTGALHSSDYVPASPGASPPYAQAGMGLDFGDKEFEGENFAIDATGKLYAHGAEFTGSEITGGRITLTDAGGSNPNLRIYKETDPDNYGTVIGSVSWLKEWYDPNDQAMFYYYAWRFNNGEMTGGVADDAMRMRLNWQKGTIEAVGNAYLGSLDLDTPLPIESGGTGAASRLGAAKNLTNENVGTSATNFVTLTSNWGKFGYSTVAQVRTLLNVFANTTTAGSNSFIIDSDGSTVYRFVFTNAGNLRLDTSTDGGTNWTTVKYAIWNSQAGITELYSGTFKSGSAAATFSRNYDFYIIYGSSGGGARESVVVPKVCIGTSNTAFLISDDETWLSVNLKYSGSTITMTWEENKKTGGTTLTSGFINRVYGVIGLK